MSTPTHQEQGTASAFGGDHNPRKLNNIRGIIAMNLAMLVFILNDSIVKLMRQEWETGQILFVRGIFSLIMVMLWMYFSDAMKTLRQMAQPHLMLRATIEAVIAATYIVALGMAPLADITAFMMLAPLLVTALSVVFLRTKVGWRRWAAVIFGFVGTLFIVRPTGLLPNGWVSSLSINDLATTAPMPLWAAFLAFISVVGVAWRDLITGRIPSAIPSVLITLTSVVATVFSGLSLLMMGETWHAFSIVLVGECVLAALFIVLGNFAVITACRDVDFAVVMPFRYTILLWAMLMGFLLFGEKPDALSLFGMGMIAASGLYTLYREKIRKA